MDREEKKTNEDLRTPGKENKQWWKKFKYLQECGLSSGHSDLVDFYYYYGGNDLKYNGEKLYKYNYGKKLWKQRLKM